MGTKDAPRKAERRARAKIRKAAGSKGVSSARKGKNTKAGGKTNHVKAGLNSKVTWRSDFTAHNSERNYRVVTNAIQTRIRGNAARK